ncbi:MAG: trypsin-like peptidase domain-containing protein [Burkholderiaceae bacterium]|nr:trypsin-like peptidase domain-containing protein [Burkholderiaceae bacterium]
MLRARALAGLLSLAASASWGQGSDALATTPLQALAAQRLRERAAQPLTPASEAERQVLLAAARTALAQGDSQTALNRLEAAAAMSHAADTELLVVQARVQGGDYRQGLSFASHTAGAHLNEPRALALYGWMLGLGEQAPYALRLIDAGLARMPEQPQLMAVKQQLTRLEADAAAETSPEAAAFRPGPLATGSAVPDHGQALASGLLIADGRLALVPLEALEAARDTQALWVRNGLGVTRSATLHRRISGAGLALLRLDTRITPAPGATPLTRPPRDAFAGSPASTLSYLAAPGARPAWPAMHTGFLGRAGMGSTQALGIGLPQGSHGGAVFDHAGRLIGIGLAPRMVPLSALLAELPTELEALPVSMDATKRPPDQLYEQALPLTVQVLAARP